MASAKKAEESRKVRYTKKALRDCLIELMREKSIAKISVKELCEKADLNRSTFYAHYRDQYELLEGIEEETLSWAEDMIDGLLGKPDSGELAARIEGILRYIVENALSVQVLLGDSGDQDFPKKLVRLIYRKCGLEPAGRRPGRTSMEYAYVFVIDGSVGLIRLWMKEGFKKSEREIAQIISGMASQITRR